MSEGEVYELRNTDFPVRIQIQEGADPEEIALILRKSADLIENTAGWPRRLRRKPLHEWAALEDAVPSRRRYEDRS